MGTIARQYIDRATEVKSFQDCDHPGTSVMTNDLAQCTDQCVQWNLSGIDNLVVSYSGGEILYFVQDDMGMNNPV